VWQSGAETAATRVASNDASGEQGGARWFGRPGRPAEKSGLDGDLDGCRERVAVAQSSPIEAPAQAVAPTVLVAGGEQVILEICIVERDVRIIVVNDPDFPNSTHIGSSDEISYATQSDVEAPPGRHGGRIPRGDGFARDVTDTAVNGVADPFGRAVAPRASNGHAGAAKWSLIA
jgi:hypothetical protein